MNEHELVARLMHRDEILLIAMLVMWGAIMLFALVASVWLVVSGWYDDSDE